MEKQAIEIKKENVNSTSMLCIKDCNIMFDGILYKLKKDLIYNFSLDFKNHLYYNGLLKFFVYAKDVIESKKSSEVNNAEDTSKVVSKSVKKN